MFEVPHDEILADYNDLEREDLLAVLDAGSDEIVSCGGPELRVKS